MKRKREPKVQVVPPKDELLTEVAGQPAKEMLPTTYYGERGGGDKSPQDYKQIREMRERFGGQRGMEQGTLTQEGTRQQRINAEVKANEERLNRTRYSE